MSFVIGNAQVIEVFKRFRSQIDYGIFLPVQAGAVAALKSDDAAVQEPVQKISGKKRCTVRRTSRDWVEHSRQRGNYVCMGATAGRLYEFQ